MMVWNPGPRWRSRIPPPTSGGLAWNDWQSASYPCGYEKGHKSRSKYDAARIGIRIQRPVRTVSWPARRAKGSVLRAFHVSIGVWTWGMRNRQPGSGRISAVESLEWRLEPAELVRTPHFRDLGGHSGRFLLSISDVSIPPRIGFARIACGQFTWAAYVRANRIVWRHRAL
jgi:hypothetical protein